MRDIGLKNCTMYGLLNKDTLKNQLDILLCNLPEKLVRDICICTSFVDRSNILSYVYSL